MPTMPTSTSPSISSSGLVSGGKPPLGCISVRHRPTISMNQFLLCLLCCQTPVQMSSSAFATPSWMPSLQMMRERQRYFLAFGTVRTLETSASTHSDFRVSTMDGGTRQENVGACSGCRLAKVRYRSLTSIEFQLTSLLSLLQPGLGLDEKHRTMITFKGRVE